jgi:REP-associated tyrosine transposase
MARANRYYAPGLIWHITQRCHKREFLLKFSRDKAAWLRWIRAAQTMYGLCVLNFIITSNHIHLLVMDRKGDRQRHENTIAKSLQLVEARVAQEYNQRKDRSGAFWEDRYHATAIETGEHFINCLVYIDLNMVRAKVVADPGEWPFSGYYELQRPRLRFRNQLTDWRTLLSVLGLADLGQLRAAREVWAAQALQAGALDRDPKWTESVAVGCREYVEEVVEKLGGKAIGRDVLDEGKLFVLKEEGTAYLCVFGGKNEDLRHKTNQ